MKTVTGIYPSMIEAHHAANALAGIGVPTEDISIIAGNNKNLHDEYLAKAKKASETTESAALSGASLGGGLGILATLFTIAIPGVGPILAIGPFATVLAGMGAGAAAGGFLSAFHHMGIDHEIAPLYEEAVRRGAVMVVATVSLPVEQEAVAVMARHGARDIRDEAETWAASGWSGPKHDPHPYPSDDSIRSSEMPETVEHARG